MSTAAFADLKLEDRLFKAFTTDGSDNVCLRVIFSAAPTFTMNEGANIVLGTTTGTKIGTATTQKLGFFNATPIVQPAAGDSLEVVLSGLGLRASGSSAPLSMGILTIADGASIIAGSSSGLKIGTATTQKLGFFNATPIVQPSAYTQTYATADKTHANPTATSLTSNGASGDNTLVDVTTIGVSDPAKVNANFDDVADEVNKLIVDLADAKQLVNSLIDDLQALGLIG